jgi:hypothetical protein
MSAASFIDAPVPVSAVVSEGFGRIRVVAGANQHFAAGFADGNVVMGCEVARGWIRLAFSWRAGVFVARSGKESVHRMGNFVETMLDQSHRAGVSKPSKMTHGSPQTS